MRNLKRMASFFMAFVLLVSFTAEAAAADDKVFNFNMTGGYMMLHPTVQHAFLPWAARIKERTGGKVNITYFNPNTLGPEPEHFELTRKGQIDIGHNVFARNTGRLLVSTVIDIPQPVTHPPAASVAMWRMYQRIPEMQKELEGIKILGMHASAPTQFDWVIDENITHPNQMKGKKLLVGGGEQAKMVRNMGASSMIIPANDFYLSLSRNMADGCMLPIAPLRSIKLTDVLKTITVCNLNIAGWWIGMSWTSWNSLPPEYQKIIDEESGEKLSYMGGRSIWDGNEADIEWMKKETKIRLNYVSAEDRQAWIDYAIPPFKEEWFKKMEQRKLPAQRIYDEAQRIYEECAGIDYMDYSYKN